MVSILVELERHQRQCRLDQAIIDELVIMPPPLGLATPTSDHGAPDQPPPRAPDRERPSHGSENLIAAVLARINHFPGRVVQRAALRRWWRNAVIVAAAAKRTTAEPKSTNGAVSLVALQRELAMKTLTTVWRSTGLRRHTHLFYRWRAAAQRASHRRALELKEAEFVSANSKAARDVIQVRN